VREPNTTWVLRHAPTAYSEQYRVNSDPSTAVPLSARGRQLARGAAGQLSVEPFVTVVTSRLPRTAETAGLLLGDRQSIRIEPGLDELDYGQFDGGPFATYARWLLRAGQWAVPPGGSESQISAIRRMLAGLLSCLGSPGPRLVIGHGLLLSVLSWAREYGHAPVAELFLPEAPCLEPLTFTDAPLRDLIMSCLYEIDEARPSAPDVAVPAFLIGDAGTR
jgi:probable phosphoglycerate mutase